MNIGGVSRDLSTQSVQSTRLQPTDGSIQPEASLDPNDSATQVQLSKPGELMQKLSQLSSSDPSKFKDVAQKLSDSFAAAVKNATGEDAKRLQDMADKFASAAESGELSALRPAQAPQGAAESAQASYAHHAHGHHHHHGGGGGGGVGGPSQTMRDAFSSAVSIVDAATN